MASSVRRQPNWSALIVGAVLVWSIGTSLFFGLLGRHVASHLDPAAANSPAPAARCPF
ncbi:MAG: hypothetical protein IT204_14245 [Fimbriimonadaceae bacterium]|nr:hypothetical protein [Fimbriimonadaceae bacterium]